MLGDMAPMRRDPVLALEPGQTSTGGSLFVQNIVGGSSVREYIDRH